MAERAFSITAGRGFQIQFPTGVMVSVQFGPGNYCDNRDMASMDEVAAGRRGCDNAEVALMRSEDGRWLTKECLRDVFGEEESYDDVTSRSTPSTVAKMIAWASAVDLSRLPLIPTYWEEQDAEEAARLAKVAEEAVSAA